jgi:hypothetical protein
VERLIASPIRYRRVLGVDEAGGGEVSRVDPRVRDRDAIRTAGAGLGFDACPVEVDERADNGAIAGGESEWCRRRTTPSAPL